MATPPLLFNFIGVVFTAVLYGFYCSIFGKYWRIQLKRADRWKRVLLYALTLNFILCTAYFIIFIIQVQFDITMSVRRDNSLALAVSWMTIAANALYVSIDLISQLILLYRCWIMWRQPLVMVIPCILSLAFLVTALTTLGFQIRDIPDNQPLPDWYSSAVTAFFYISLGVNALATGLIVYRIIQGYASNLQVQAGADRKRQLGPYPLASILMGSGLMTFVGQLTQAIMYKYASTSFPLVGGCVVMIYGISMTLVLVRLETGASYDHNTPGSVNSLNSEPLASLTVSFNRTTKVEW